MSDDHRDHRAHGDEEYAHLYRDPIERFGQLPETTRKWLENLREDDIAEIKNALKLYRRVNSGGWLIKYLLGTIVVTFVGAMQFGEAIQKFVAWITHFGRVP